MAISLPLALAATDLLCLQDVPVLSVLYQGNHMVCGSLHLASFSQPNIGQCGCVAQLLSGTHVLYVKRNELTQPVWLNG